MEKKVKYKILILMLIFVFFLLSFITTTNISGFLTMNNKTDSPKYDEIATAPVKQKTNFVDNLKAKYKNNDIVGKIAIPGTDIDEIVLQSNDNQYYLDHDINKKTDKKGSIFLDFRANINNSKKIIIYGHNSQTYNIPFHELEKYYSKDFYQTHQYVEITTNYGTNKYQIFSVYVENKDWSYLNMFSENWQNHYQKIKDKSWYDTGVDINENDETLIIQTCSFYSKYKNDARKYIIIAAKKV